MNEQVKRKLSLRKWCLPPQQNRCIYGLQRWWQHTQVWHWFNPSKISAPRRRSGHGVPPLIKKLPETDPCWQRKTGFLQMSVTKYIHHTPGQAPWPGLVSQHISRVFLCRYGIFSLIFCCCFVCGLFSVSWVYCLSDLIFVFVRIF